MKAVRITELDEITEYPVDYILKSEGIDEIAGCCPKTLFNFFGLLKVIEGLNSEFLFWLKSELKEDDTTLIVPPEGLKRFASNSIFQRIDCGGGFTRHFPALSLIQHLKEGWVLFTVLLKKGTENPSHCVVFYIRDGKLFADGEEITLQTFTQKVYCHEMNRFIIGKRKARD